MGRIPLTPADEAVLAAALSENTARTEWREAFDAVFWPNYPRKVAKHAARQSWQRIYSRRLSYKGHEDLLGRIVKGLVWYVGEEWAGRHLQVIPHAATWLNQRRWEDAFEDIG